MASKQYNMPPEMQIDTEKNYKAKIELEKGGGIVIDLLVKEAPKPLTILYSLRKRAITTVLPFIE